MPTRPLRTLIAVLGTAGVTAYAVALVLQISVWNPLAAVPGLTLAEIDAQAAARGETVFSAAPWAFAGIGVALAVGVLVLAIRAKGTSTTLVVAAYLALLVGGAPAYFTASFGPGMALADAFGTVGVTAYAVALGGSVLMVVSGAAATALVVWGVALATTARAARPALPA